MEAGWCEMAGEDKTILKELDTTACEVSWSSVEALKMAKYMESMKKVLELKIKKKRK